VVAGTATAVAGGVRSRQNAKAQDAAEAQAYEQQQAQPAAQQAAEAAPAESASGGSDLMGDIQGLAALHAQGVLSDDEFAAAKAKLLS
jgi:hypothetical protein